MDGSVLAAWAGAAASLFGAGLTVWWPWHNRPQADWTLLEHSTNPELPISSTVRSSGSPGIHSRTSDLFIFLISDSPFDSLFGERRLLFRSTLI